MSQSWKHRQKFENLCFAKKFLPQKSFQNQLAHEDQDFGLSGRNFIFIHTQRQKCGALMKKVHFHKFSFPINAGNGLFEGKNIF